MTCNISGAKVVRGSAAAAMAGFAHRAKHNLWTLPEEAHLAAGDYAGWYREHLRNTIYLPLIQRTLRSARRPD